MNEALKLAISVGYESPLPTATPNSKDDDVMGFLLTKEMEIYFSPLVFTDPKFWQALGKALGWGEFVGMIKGGTPVWLNQAHEYFEIKLTNGDENAFWKELLTSQQTDKTNH
jgi:hypothetical protein